jgi:Acyl-CoA dehydrogenase, N-terminal domain
MYIDLTPDQRALRDELRGYFAGLASPAERAELLTERHGAVYREVVRRMGRDRWLGVGWPARYGGRGFGPVEQQIFADERDPARADRYRRPGPPASAPMTAEETIRAAAARLAAAGDSRPRAARDPVNLPTIRTWIEAIDPAGPDEPGPETAPPAGLRTPWSGPSPSGSAYPATRARRSPCPGRSPRRTGTSRRSR